MASACVERKSAGGEAKPAVGVLLPANAKGERSSTSFGKDVMASAAGVEDCAELATAIAAVKDWRGAYVDYFVQLCEAGAESRERAVNIARRGLDRARAAAEFSRGGEAVPLEALAQRHPGSSPELAFVTASVAGSAAEVEAFGLPYKGKVLAGEEAAAQLDAWAAKGCMEESCALAAKLAVTGGGVAPDLRGHQFVVLGAGSELGPFELLLAAGATVLAVGTRRPERWGKFIAAARASAGTLLVPLAPGTDAGAADGDLAAAAGCDLSEDLPEVLAWVLKNVDAQKPLTVGTYIYADGEANVRLTLASDVIVQAVAALPCVSPPAFAWIGSPSTGNVLPPGCVEAAVQKQAEASWWQRLMGYEPNNARPAVAGSGLAVVNGYLAMQGPNYALAQQLRAWRVAELLSRGLQVSFNMAPGCRTASVLKSTAIKTALRGMAHFDPIEIFDSDTARAVMFALLLADVKADVPSVAAAKDRHPMEQISHQAFHGGFWRCAYRPDSCQRMCFLLGMVWPLD